MRAVKKSPVRTYWPVMVILLAGLGISGALGARFHRQAVEVDRARFQRVANQVVEALNARVEKVEMILRQFQDYLTPHQNITEPVYYNWCWKRDLPTSVPWCYGLFFWTNRNASRWREVVPPDVKTWTTNDIERFSRFCTEAPIHLQPAAAAGTYSQYVWVTNYSWHWSYREVTNRPFVEPDGCLDGNAVRTTGRQQITRERKTSAPQYGAALVLPLLEADYDKLSGYLAMLKPKLPPHRLIWNTCRGILIAPIEYGRVETDIWNDIPQEVGIEIFAAPRPSLDVWLNPKPGGSRALDTRFQPYISDTVLLKMYARRWAIFIYTTPLFEEASPRRMATLTMMAGVGITLLASALVAVALRAHARQEGMTAEVIEARDALEAVKKQRERLGHDLHDGVIQSLYAMRLKLGGVGQTLTGSESVRDELALARAELDTIIADIRRFILVEEQADKAVDLCAVLRALVQRSSTEGNARIELDCHPEASARLSPAQAVQAANIAQEALSNSLRHARPSKITVVLDSDNDAVRLEVCDDGMGFEPKGSDRQGIGLTSMAARSRELHGTLQIDSTPGCGTRVVVRIPASQKQRVTAQ